MLISLLIYIKIIYTAAKIYNGPEFNESEPNSSHHIWHSYSFNTGVGNREEIYISNAELNNNVESTNGVFLWKNLQIQEQIVIVGLGNDFLTITALNAENNSFTFKEEFEGSGRGVALFQKWSAKVQRMENFLILAIHTSEENYTLKWYQIFSRRLKFLWNWQFHGSITYLDIIKINYEPKLLIVNHKGNNRNPSADIYSFSVNNILDIWLFEKINLDGIPSSVTVFDNNDNIFFCVSFPSLEVIHIFKYSKCLCVDMLDIKHFIFHQKIFSLGLKSLMSFRVGFRWYLAVASKTSLIYKIGENYLFQPISNLKLGSFNNWLGVPVDTYREDTILLADTNSDISIITWSGDEHLKVLGSFTEFVCGNDTSCLEKMESIALNESSAFDFNGEQNIIMSTKNGNPLFFKLIIKLKPLPDSITLKLMDVLNMKNSLEKNYANQKEQVDALLSEKRDLVKIKSTSFSTSMFELNQVPEIVSQRKNLSVIITDVNQLKTEVKLLSHGINEFLKDLKLNLTGNDGENSDTFLARNVTDGIMFYGNVLINELNLSNVNGYDVNELLADSFRKNVMHKLGGKKTLKMVNVENVIFEKIGNTLACDVVFSDDPWEEVNRNIVNGDLIWQNRLNVVNDVRIFPEAFNWNNSLGEITRGSSKHIYDVLNLEELEVTESTHIQKTVNGQPFILPVHSAQLNILDIVNQARIEIVKVQQNLEIDFINGKNFSDFLDQVLFKPPIQNEFDILKIDGVFSARVLESDRLNNIDFSKGKLDFDRDEFSQKLLANDPDFYVVQNSWKKSKSENSRRVIHVFQNLDVNGILFSNKINNISWMFLNDTVKKSDHTVKLSGTKTFEKLTTRKINLSGTLNGRFAENILTKFSDQIIRNPQVFDKVSFKNVTLRGAWDGVFPNELNKTVVRLSSNNGQVSDITFEDVCFMNSLNVTGFVNNVSLNGSDAYKKNLNNKIELKLIKAANAVLQGSLITNSKINNMNLSDFSLLRVSLKSPETIERDLLHHNVTIFGNLNLETLNLNDVFSIINSGGDTTLIEKFLNGEIHKIKKLLVKGNITTSHGINGFNVSKIVEKAVSITKPGSIKGNVTFENIINFDNINVTNSIDGFPLKNLEKDIAFKHGHVFLSGPKNFSTVIVTKNMKARSLNGHLIQEVASLKGDETMRDLIQINGNVVVKGNLTSYAAINNLTIPDLLKTFSTKVNSFIYSGDLNLRSDQVSITNLVVDGLIQNVSLKKLIDDAVMKDADFYISGKKTFKGEVKFNKDVSVTGFIHGVNFSRFYSDVAFIDHPTKLEGTVTINKAVLKVLNISGDFNSTLINNIDTNDWLEDSIPLNKYVVVNGRKTFKEAHAQQEVTVDFINGHLPSAMISLKEEQHIPALALFPRIHTTSDLSVAGFVNNKNLIKEFQDTVLRYGSQTIDGKTLFDEEFVINGNLFVNTIQGKSVDGLITLDTEQVIKSPLDFNGKVTAKENVNNLKFINNVNLREWNQSSVLLNTEQVLNGLWTIKGKVKAKNINGEGLLYAISLPSFSKDLRKGRLLAVETKNATKLEYSEQCQKVEELSEKLSHLPYLFDQFVIADEIETSAVIDSVITFKISNSNQLIITYVNECFSSLYKWNRENGTFDYLRQINIGPVNKWLIVYRNQATYLVTSSLKNSAICEENLKQGNVWVFKGDSDKYTHLLSTDAFVDVIHKNNTSDEFFTIDENGVLRRWTLGNDGNITSKFLLNVGPNNYRFIDFRIMEGLAISNGREIKHITLTEDKVIENNISLVNAHIVALPTDGKSLIAVVVKDKIVIYENIIEDKIYSVIHTYRGGSVLWLNYGPKKQAFLVVASHHRLIEIYEYKNVAGLVKKMSIQMFSSRLQSETLPARSKHQSNKFVIVIQKKKLIFLRADMIGDFIKNDDSFC